MAEQSRYPQSKIFALFCSLVSIVPQRATCRDYVLQIRVWCCAQLEVVATALGFELTYVINIAAADDGGGGFRSAAEERKQKKVWRDGGRSPYGVVEEGVERWWFSSLPT
ncbi:hypothetical protein SESBI_32687 [Sesbania bispinosa]|nr:hypothetical protein SESBI_32687 [Sesbania bispinosa]